MGTQVPTALQIQRIRADFGTMQSAYEDPDIIDVWSRVSAARNESIQHDATLALMARQLLANVAIWRDISTGNTSEKLSQARDGVMLLVKLYGPALEKVQGNAKAIKGGSLRSGKKPPEVPIDNSYTWGSDPSERPLK